MKDYETYLFDIDGTLLDTMDLIYTTYRETLRRYSGPSLTREEILSKVGIPLPVQMGLFFTEQEERLPEIIQYYRDYQEEIYRDVLKTFPRVPEVLKELKDRGKTLGVVTSRTLGSLTKYLRHCELEEYFHILITPEKTSRHKPHPEPVLCALEELGCDGKKTLFTGDASVDMESGHGAGTDTAFALWGPNDPESLNVKPTWLLSSMDDLLV